MRLEDLSGDRPADAAATRQPMVYKVMDGSEPPPISERVRPLPFRPRDGEPSPIFALRRGLDAGSLLKSRLNSLFDGRLESPAHGSNSGGEDASGVVEAGFFDFVPNPIDVLEGVLEAGSDLLDAGVGAVREALKRGGRFLLGAAEVVIDAGNKTIDFVGDVANDVKAAADVLKFAAEHGLQLVGRAREEVHRLMLAAINKSLGMGDKIVALGVGDSYTLSGGVDAGWGADGSVEGAVEVTREGDDCYVVSAEVSADVGAKLFEGAAVGAGARVEFKFDNPEDAKRAALILAAGGLALGAAASAASGNPAAAVLLPALEPTGDEIDFLQSHLSAAEITGSVGAELDGKLEAGALGNGAAFEGEVSHSYRMEFENGKPVALVRTTELFVSGDAASNLIISQVGEQAGSALIEAMSRGGEVTGTVTVETRLALDGARISDVATFLIDPDSAAFVGGAETSIRASVAVDLGGRGVEAEVELSRLSIGDARQVVGGLLRGDVRDVLRNLPFDVSGSVSSFEDTGHTPHLNLKVQGFGIEVEGRSEERDRTTLDRIGD